MTKFQLTPQTALNFIEALTGSQHTPCTWQTFADKKGLFRSQAEIFHGSFAHVWPRIKSAQTKGAGIFLTIQETDLQGRKDGNITALRACFVDFDPPTIQGKKQSFTEQERAEIFERLAAAPLPPHITINSGAGIHAYWLLKPGQPIEQFRDTQKALIRFFDTDKAVHDLPRVMRLPGTVHLKADPRTVTIEEINDHPRVTLEQIRAAYPMPVAAKPKRTGVTYSDIDPSSDYAHVLNMTRGYVLKAARSCTDGSRHNALKSVMPAIVARLKPSEAAALVQEFCQVTGLPESEALDVLKWGSDNQSKFTARLPERKLNTRRCKVSKIEGPTKEQTRRELYEHLAGILYSPDRRFHLIQVTTGLGKTSQLADVLNELYRRAWPQREDGTPARILMLVDNHKLAQEFHAQLDFGAVEIFGQRQTPIEIYKGRNKDNCDEFETIKKSETPASYCKGHCPVYKAKQCAYYGMVSRTQKQPLVIAAKQAFLHESSDLSQFDVIIADENLSDHLYHQNKVYTREDLHQIKQAVNLAGLNREQAAEALAFIDGLLAEMDTPEVGNKVLKRTAPLVEAGKIEKFFQLGKGQYLNPRRFFSLFETKYRLRVTTGADPRLHLTARRDVLISKLKNATVINLDATPNKSMLAEFNPLEFCRNLDQNVIYWQDSDYKFTRAMLKQKRFQDTANARIRSIYERTEGETVVFTFKDDRENMQALMPPGTRIGVYGADSKGTNQFENCENFILKASFTPNIDAMKDLASVAGIKADRLIRDKQDAELLQVIGRARGVNRIKPANIFVLTNRPLKLDKKPRPLREFFKNTTCRQMNSPEPARQAVLHTTEDKMVSNIEPTAMKNSTASGFEAVFSRVRSLFSKDDPEALKTIRNHVEACLVQYGFYCHDLAGFGSGSFCSEALAPLPDISKAQYNRYIQQVLNKWESHRVNLDEGKAVKVWGDKQAAIDFVTDKAELAAAIDHVKTEYHRPGGLLNMVFTLGEFKIQSNVKQWLGDREYTRDNWAVLLYRIHKRRQAELIATV